MARVNFPYPDLYPPKPFDDRIPDILTRLNNLESHNTSFRITWTDVLEKPLAYPPTEHTHSISQVSGLSAALAQKASLENGTVPANQLPQLVKRQSLEANQQSVMLTLPANLGDTCTRTDEGNSVYMLVRLPVSDVNNWVLLRNNVSTFVNRINGKTGDVTLSAADVGATPAAHATDYTNPHRVTKTQVGLGSVINAEQVPLSSKGKPNGVAPLDENGFVKAENLPPTVTALPERRVVETTPVTLAAKASVDIEGELSSVRFSGIRVLALGLDKLKSDRLKVSLYGSGAAGAWGDLMYQAEFGFQGSDYLTADNAQGWTYRDLSNTKVVRIRLENTGDTPISGAAVSIVTEEY